MSNIQAQRSERVALRLTPELKAQIEELAAADDVTLSKWLERAAREAAERRRRAN
jgi:predicted HicB family RNase H-like nuclease